MNQRAADQPDYVEKEVVEIFYSIQRVRDIGKVLLNQSTKFGIDLVPVTLNEYY